MKDVVWYLEDSILITPAGEVSGQVVLVENGRITAVDTPSHLPCPPHATRLSGQGQYLAPGFIDVQLNGGFGHDFTSDPTTIWAVAAELPAHGVTSFLPTIITSPPETVAKAQAVLAMGRSAGEKIGARPCGLHLEGPFFNPAKKGAHNPALLRLPSPTAVGEWTAANHVALVTLAPELPGAIATIHALRQQGVQVSAGHSMATYAETQAGFAAGIRYGTHLFNAMPPLGHREPGLAGALLLNDTLITGIIADGVHTHPDMIRLAWQLKQGNLNLVTDAMAALGMPPGNYQLGSFAISVSETTAQLPDGTLAGSLLRLDTAVQNLLRWTGCTLAEAVMTVTATPARLLAREHELGKIAPGYRADLVWLTAVGQVQRTMVNGTLLYQNMRDESPRPTSSLIPHPSYFLSL
jgi:N-acetylglucosamine-6-phosphate deacetylase